MFHDSGISCHVRRDEFAVFIARVPPENIFNEQLRILCRALRYEFGEDDKIKISASLGVIVSNDTAMQYELLSNFGEVAIHESKRKGGNTYSYFSENLVNIPKVPQTQELEREVSGEPLCRTERGHHVFVRAFGYFEVFLDGNPIDFTSKKAKELFAMMIDRRGGFVGASEAITYLWDDASNDKTVFARYRKVAMRLREILQGLGIEDILENSGGYRRIISDKIECDYYNYLSGNVKFKDLFRGSYMTNYSWAEETLAELWSSHEGNSRKEE